MGLQQFLRQTAALFWEMLFATPVLLLSMFFVSGLGLVFPLIELNKDEFSGVRFS